MERNLKALIPHQFGDHSFCKPHFCGYKRSPQEVYPHRSLPYRTSLKDPDLRTKLEKLFAPVTCISNVDRYCDLGSSQQCEHANREVTLRAPKSLHYGNSEYLDFRVMATSAFINEGRKYITQVEVALSWELFFLLWFNANAEAGISPGKYTEAYAEKQLKHRKYVQEKMKLPSQKRRRLVLKQERAVTKGAMEASEGVSYQPGIGYEENVDIEQIPSPVSKGYFKPIPWSPQDRVAFITFDLETTVTSFSWRKDPAHNTSCSS